MKEVKQTKKSYKTFELTAKDINRLVKDKLTGVPMEAEVMVSIDTPGVGAVYLEGSSIIAEAAWEEKEQLVESRAALLPETIAVTVKDVGTWPDIKEGDIYRVVRVERIKPKNLYIGLMRVENDGK